MANLHIGDSVTFRDRAYFIRGMSPMGVTPRRIHLEDADTGERIEVPEDQAEQLIAASSSVA